MRNPETKKDNVTLGGRGQGLIHRCDPTGDQASLLDIAPRTYKYMAHPSSIGDFEERVAVATHQHIDVSALLGGDVNLPSSTNGPKPAGPYVNLSDVSGRDESSLHCPPVTARGETRPAHSVKSKRGREAYDPELEKLVRERVHELNVHVEEDTATNAGCTSASVSAECVEPRPPCSKDKDAPSVPPRRTGITATSTAGVCDTSGGSIPVNTNTLHNQMITSSLGTLPEKEVCQQYEREFVNNGEHDYINQDYLDSILEEQESEIKPTNGCSMENDDDDMNALLRKGNEI